MNVSELSKVELNRAMIWLYLAEGFDCRDDGESYGNYKYGGMSKGWYINKINYLTDYNLTMPLAVENMMTVANYKNITCADDFIWGFKSNHKDPLRAICEVLVMIALEERA